MKKKMTFRKWIAALIAVLMIAGAVPVLASSGDWAFLLISVDWTDSEGNPQSAFAYPVAEAAGSFWAMVSSEALRTALTLEVEHPDHPDWQFYMLSDSLEGQFMIPVGTSLEGAADALDTLDSDTSYIEIQAFKEDGTTEEFRLYLSSVTASPVVLMTPEMTEEPTQEPTPEPVVTEEPTPEPVFEPVITEEPTPEPVFEPIITEEPTVEPTPEPVITEEPVFEPVITEEPTAEPTPEPVFEPVITEEPTPEPSPVPYEDLSIPLNTMLNRFGRTTTNVNFRTGSSRNSGVIRELASGETVYLIESILNENYEEWTRILVDGTEGYAMTAYLELLPSWENEAKMAAAGPMPVYTATPEPTEAPTPEPVFEPIITEEPTAEPTPEPVITEEPVYEPVITEEPTVEPTPEPVFEPVITEEPTPEPSPVPYEDLSIPLNTMLNRFGRTTTNVNFRTGSSRNNGVIRELASGETVYLIESKLNENYEEWTRILVDGIEGYAMTAYLELLPSWENEAKMAELGPMPIYTATPEPTEAPTPEPVFEPVITEEPTAEPTPEPLITEEPVFEPVITEEPTAEPTPEPVFEPVITEEPTPEPSPVPYEDLSIPLNTMLNRFGRTTTNVNFRTGSSRNNGVIRELASGETVYLIENKLNEYYEEWTRILVDGTEGYAMTAYLELMPSWENEAKMAELGPMPVYTATPEPTEAPTPETLFETIITEEPTAEPTPEPVITEEPVFEPIITEEPTAEPTPEPVFEPTITEEPTPEPSPVPQEDLSIPLDTMLNRFGRTTTNVNFRTGSSRNNGVIRELKKNETVYLIENKLNGNNEEWCRILVDGIEGYAMTEYLELLPSWENEEKMAARGSMPVYSATPEPTEAPTPEPTATPTEEPTATPTEEPTATPTEEPTATPTEEPTATPTTEPTDEPTPEPTPVPQEDLSIPLDTMLNRFGRTTTNVNFRTGSSRNNGVIRELKKNETVYLIENRLNEKDEQWTRILVNGTEGYVMTEYLELLPSWENEAKMTELGPMPIYTATPAPEPPTEEPTATPTEEPTATPTEEPTATPTEEPTATPTEEPTATPTEEPTATPTEEPTATPTEEPTATPTEEPTATPTEEPTAVPTEEPTAIPADVPTEVPTAEPTAVPTEIPTEVPTDVTTAVAVTVTPGPTPEPVQRAGYAVTIGDGAYVRNYPGTTSAINDDLPANKVVYVTGQTYLDGMAWHVIQYDSKWGYVRGDMLRMMNEYEVLAYLEETQHTAEPEVIITQPPYNPESMSCYGYVSADSVNFRKQPTTQSERISRLQKYALCLIYDAQNVDGTVWYKVGYEGTIGYVNGDYFKQMTVNEAEAFFQSKEYLEGLSSNATKAPQNAGPQTTGTPSGIASAEDLKVETWKNPDSGITVSYVPFDPFATPEPLPENDVRNKEYLDSVTERIKNGSLKEEDLEKLLEIAYRDSADKETLISSAMSYVREKLGIETEEATVTPEDIPMATEANPQFEQEKEQGGNAFGWIIGGLLVAGAAGGGYYYYNSVQKRRQAAQRLAQKKAAQQRKDQAAGKTAAGMKTSQPASAQQAAKIRTTTSRPNTTAGGSSTTGKPYAKNVENPYGRYTTSGEEDAAYTASFKPDESKNTGNTQRRRRNGNGNGDRQA